MSNKGYDLLSPVPLIHLLSAIKDGMPSEVAFGSGTEPFFADVLNDPLYSRRVWLYASVTGSKDINSDLTRTVCFVGTLCRVAWPHGSEQNGNVYRSLIDIRPMSAKIGDTAAKVLWSLKGLKAIGVLLSLSDFAEVSANNMSGVALKDAPRSLIKVSYLKG